MKKLSAAKKATKNIESDFDEKGIYQIVNTSLEDVKGKIGRCRRVFECKLKNIYAIESQNVMTCINDSEGNKTS